MTAQSGKGNREGEGIRGKLAGIRPVKTLAIVIFLSETDIKALIKIHLYSQQRATA